MAKDEKDSFKHSAGIQCQDESSHSTHHDYNSPQQRYLSLPPLSSMSRGMSVVSDITNKYISIRLSQVLAEHNYNYIIERSCMRKIITCITEEYIVEIRLCDLFIPFLLQEVQCSIQLSSLVMLVSHASIFMVHPLAHFLQPFLSLTPELTSLINTSPRLPPQPPPYCAVFQ